MVVLGGLAVSYERGTPVHGQATAAGLAVVVNRDRTARRGPRQSAGAGKFIQNRFRRRSPLLKTTALRGNRLLETPS